ncbi:MAG: carbohydrate kinase [Clostridia bacterium]|nr:carbohydrate kinase [Clostridia bacterium]
MFDVVALGELLIDFAPHSVSETGYPVLAANPGGAPGNFLAALNRYGCRTAMIGKVGDDMFGRLLIGTLKEAGIETRGVIADPDQFTTLAFVSLDETGNRDFSFARKPGADTCLRPEEVDEELILGAKVFHFGTLSLTDEPAASATRRAVSLAKENGLLISLDPNLRKPLWRSEAEAKAAMEWSLHQADIVKISDEEIDFLWGLSPEAGAEKLLKEFGVSLVYVTLGPKGCYARNASACVMVKSPSGIHVVDTTGAGDIFGGSAMSQFLKCGKAPSALTQKELESIVTFACTAASLSTQTRGGITSVPSPEAVLAKISEIASSGAGT